MLGRKNAVATTVGEELEAIVGGLRERGVVFERYDLPELTEKADIHAR